MIYHLCPGDGNFIPTEQLTIRIAHLDILRSYAAPTSKRCAWQPWMKDILANEIKQLPIKDNTMEGNVHLNTAIRKMSISGNPVMAGNTLWSCIVYDEKTSAVTSYFANAYSSDMSGMYYLMLLTPLFTKCDRSRL